MAAVPELGRAAGVEPRHAPGAAATHDLYERYSRQIFAFCVQQLGNREEAEDAVQTTFLNAFRGLSRGISPEAESAWLYKIAHNVCLTRRRSSYRRGRVETPGDMQALQDFVAAPQRMGTDELIELQEALAAMPSNQRKAILLREWRGLSYREIADEMELSQAAVETLIFRARRSLANGLEQAPPERKKLIERLRHALDVGSIAAAIKAALTGTAAAKAVATAAAVSTSVAAVATVPSDGRIPRRAHAEQLKAAAAPAPAERERTVLTSASAPSVGAAAARVERTAQPRKVAPARTRPAAASRPAAAKTKPAVVVPAAAAPTASDAPAPAPPADEPQAQPRHEPKAPAPAGDRPKASQPEKEAPQTQEPKAEGPKSQEPKSAEPNREGPKGDTPKGQGSKAEAPKASETEAAPMPRRTSGRSASAPGPESEAKAKDEPKRGYEQKEAKHEAPAAPAAEEPKAAAAAADAPKHEAQGSKKADDAAPGNSAPPEPRGGTGKADSPKTK